jgi:hypothetical protein
MSFADAVAGLDRAVFGTLGGELVTYTPPGGPESGPLSGLFSEEYQLAKGTAEAGVETVGPAVFVRLADLPIDPHVDDASMTIGGVQYRVIEDRPDGMGGVVLVLRKKT